MGTTFGIVVPSLYEEGRKEEIEIAKRTGSYIVWLNPLAQALSDDTEVIPLDNSAQGIYTIADIKAKIASQ